MRARGVRVVLVTLLFVAGITSEDSKDAAAPEKVATAQEVETPAESTRVSKVLVKRTPLAREPEVRPLPALAPAPFSLPGAGADAARPQRSAAGERWARFISEYAGHSPLPNWANNAVMVDLPLGRGADGRRESTPVLVLPVPVPVAVGGASECSAEQALEQPRGGGRRPPLRQQPRPIAQIINDYAEDDARIVEDYEDAAPAPRPRPRPAAPKPRLQPAILKSVPVRLLTSGTLGDNPTSSKVVDRGFGSQRPLPPHSAQQPAAPQDDAPQPTQPQYDAQQPTQPQYDAQQSAAPQYNALRLAAPQPAAPRPRPSNSFKVQAESPLPTLEDSPTSPQVLVELFRSQKPRAPELPPVLTRDRRSASAEPRPPPVPGPVSGSYLPPAFTALQFDRSLAIRGEVTVHRADYTETYTALWDAATGAARVDLHGGTATSYRTADAGGTVQRLAITVDRSGGHESVRCAVLRRGARLPSDAVPPVLPDPAPFAFEGYTDINNVRAEKWIHTLKGRAGELGGARGEALVFRHELLVTRGLGGIAVPLQYSVAVDSSLLGADCDTYVHRYHEVREQDVDPSLFQIDYKSACEQLEETTDLGVVEPLREFTLPARDPRYDELFAQFISQHNRQYWEPAEEAVRKNQLMQSYRFVNSGNRIGASFAMSVNFLGDRLDAEVSTLTGVVEDIDHFGFEQFPHEKRDLLDLERKLPDEFDWRQKGGVTPVKFQGFKCSSCWAFAVTGAVEGALFRVARRLVPLSEQALVDCAHPYGGRGCGGTWPSHAYDYVQDRGLPAESEYTSYEGKVLQCQAQRVSPVTHISAHVNVTANSVPALKVAIRKHAPTVVLVDAEADSFKFYNRGVIYDDRCHRESRYLKHAVLAVGWMQQDGEPFFILKNSWSAGWGDQGYVRVHGSSNTCGVLTRPSYPRLERDDVRRLD